MQTHNDNRDPEIQKVLNDWLHWDPDEALPAVLILLGIMLEYFPDKEKKVANVASLWYLHLSEITRKAVHPQNSHGNPRHGKAAALPNRGTQDDFTPRAAGSG